MGISMGLTEVGKGLLPKNESETEILWDKNFICNCTPRLLCIQYKCYIRNQQMVANLIRASSSGGGTSSSSSSNSSSSSSHGNSIPWALVDISKEEIKGWTSDSKNNEIDMFFK